MNKQILLIITLLGLATACNRQPEPSPKATTSQVAQAESTPAVRRTELHDRSSYKPKSGYVPDEQTAIAIAVAIWIPIYGKEQIENEKPFRATLKDGVWTVTGTLPEGYDGGTALAEIAQDDGRILRVIHFQ